MKANTDAIDALTAELKRQTELAESVRSTSNFQLTKSLADIVNGHIVARGFKPGDGTSAY